MDYLRKLPIIFLALILSVTAYNLTLTMDEEIRLKEDNTIEIILNYNTSLNETAQHNCYFTVYETGRPNTIVYSDQYMQYYPISSQLQTGENGYLQYKWRPLTNFAYGQEYTAQIRCLNLTDTKNLTVFLPNYMNSATNSLFSFQANSYLTNLIVIIGAIAILFIYGMFRLDGV